MNWGNEDTWVVAQAVLFAAAAGIAIDALVGWVRRKWKDRRR